jgi:hypothetical protein
VISAALRDRVRALDLRLFHWPPDPGHAYRGTATTDRVDLRVVRYGGCEFRSMPVAHTLASQAGYPRHLGNLLAARGMLMEFSNIFVNALEYLPRTADGLREHVKLTGEPDVVLVQVGTHYSYRTILGVGLRRSIVRDMVGRALGRHVFAAYRMANPIFRHIGRHYLPYHGPARLREFLELVRRECPDAHVVVLGLFPPFADGAFSPTTQSAVSRELLEEAERVGVDTIDMEEVVPRTPAVYCSNGAQLNEQGSRLVAEAILGWLVRRGLARTRVSAST